MKLSLEANKPITLDHVGIFADGVAVKRVGDMPFKLCKKYVDEIIPYQYEQDLWDILKSYSINIRIVGADHKGSNFSGLDICKDLGIEVYYNHRDHDFSSTDLRKRIAKAEQVK